MDFLRDEYATEFRKRKEQLEAWYACDHKDKIQYRQRVLRDGSIAVYRQCSHCGKAFGAAKRDSFSATLPPFDEELAEERYQELRHKLDDLRESLLARQRAAHEARDGEWWDWYNAYLDSPEWKQKRSRVLDRADGICEGCGINRASQVHHLTYKNVGNEFLFELVAVCNICHERLHEKRHAKENP